MKRYLAVLLIQLPFIFWLASSAAVESPQPVCSALNAAQGEGKFTGQVSQAPDGSMLVVTYAGQSVLVHYGSTVSVCQGGQPTSIAAVTRGASVSVFGPMRRNGQTTEIDAARIFVAGRSQMVQAGAATLPAGDQPAPPGASASSAQAPPVQPIRATSPARANSVILGGGTQQETIQRLRVVHQYALADVRANSRIVVGEAQVDFRPMLENPRALFNVADQLRAMPQHVQVRESSFEVSEVEQGLVIHHVLSYSILPGKCRDADAKVQLARAGVECFKSAPASERLAEFSTPGSMRYQANPQERQAAIAAFQRNSALSDAEADKHIAELRKALADPTQRAAITAQIGQAEATRMSGFSDEQLKEEMINSAVQRFEETMYVPNPAGTQYAHPPHTLKIAASPGEMAAAQQLLRAGTPEGAGGAAAYPKLLKVVPAGELRQFASAPASGGEKAADLEMGPYIFLTGFTIDHDYEWNWGVQITVNWCVVGCSSTYGVNLNAGFNYAFGLRFPIQTQLKYHTVVHANNKADADVTVTSTPIEGTVDDFFSTGLSADQIFDGKELVAQVGADAGYSVNLPVLSGSNEFQVGVDFTGLLPAPYTNGRFQPPAPGTHGIDTPYVLNGVDLLGGLLNYGVVGGEVFPAVNINLHSDKLQLTLYDEILGRQTRVTFSGQTVALGVSPGNGGDESHFDLGNPVYNLGFTLTPGLNPEVFVDITVWSNSWNWPVWFPQLAVDLPPNGVDFGCHAGTTCVMEFQPVYNAATGQVEDLSKEIAAADRTLTGGGCTQVVQGHVGAYVCPVKGMLGLCKAMLSNGAVSSCTPLVPAVVDEILKRGHCTGSNAAYVCPQAMVGLCNDYLKNQEILTCSQAK